MEGLEGNTNNNEAALSIDQAQSKCDQDHEYALPSAHTVGLGMQLTPKFLFRNVGWSKVHWMLYGYFSWPRKL